MGGDSHPRGCAALRAGYRQADLIPDDLSAPWAQTAFGEAKRPIAMPYGPDPFLNGYEVLQGLANRFPDSLVSEFLDTIDPCRASRVATERWTTNSPTS